MAEWSEIVAAVARSLDGDLQGGRDALTACWDATTPEDHAQRCVLAHYLADLQADLPDEVAWDERALAEHGGVADGDLAPVGMRRAAAMEPSLRLNLGDGYRRLGREDEAREQLAAGLAVAHRLPDDGYGATIRAGLYRLRRRLDGLEGLGT